MTTDRILFGATVVLAIVAAAGCCKKSSDSSSTTTEGEEAGSPTEAPVDPASVSPDWKTKCPAADQPQAGTAISVRDTHVHESPDQSSSQKGGLAKGTIVNLLGVHTNWYCIDFPCTTSPTGLCPGWVETREVQRAAFPRLDAGVTLTVDAAAPPTATPDAAAPVPVPDAGAGKTPTTTPDAGGGKTTPTSTSTNSKLPPGGRPPTPPKPPR